MCAFSKLPRCCKTVRHWWQAPVLTLLPLSRARKPVTQLLKIALLAVVAAVLARLDPLVALRSDGNPVSDRRVPVQIAVLDALADFQAPRPIGRRGLCLISLIHTASSL